MFESDYRFFLDFEGAKLLKRIMILAAATVLNGCSPASRPVERVAVQSPAPATTSQNYVWARNDGRRMATDPSLRRQGESDQAECRARATSGELIMPIFVSCMEGKGYHRRFT
jgi:hypothetical protein